MRRFLLAATVLGLLGAAGVYSGSRVLRGDLQFDVQDRNPVTRFKVNQADDQFQFAIVSDRTGGHRANVFSQAVEKLNLLQPEFVVSVGDLIEGGKKTPEALVAEWKEFDSFVSRLQMPFFYVAGNHDFNTPDTAKLWKEKLGRSYYHFVYKNVLFLVLNTDDVKDGIGPDQIAWAQKTLGDNAGVDWTLVFLHKPFWVTNQDKNGWLPVENALTGRNYTVFAGHVHRYQKFVRNGMNHYQLATTGGGSLMRGVNEGEFDHIVWVTMKRSGPVLANLLLDSIQTENLKPIVTDEPVNRKRLPTHPVFGKVLFEGVPIPNATVRFAQVVKEGKGVGAIGTVQADGTFEMTTYQLNDGVPAGEYEATVTWIGPYEVTPRKLPNQLPARYGTAATSGLKVTIAPGVNKVTLALKK